MFKRLSRKYVNAFSYCWYHPKVGTWLGATPELLFKLSRGQLSTVSLAGTLKVDEGMIWTKKEHEEQQLVTDYITNQLSALATEVKTGKTEEIVAGKIKHLRTKITATLAKNTQSLKEIIQVLHPTPAVCGYPKNLAMNFIEDSEHYDRSYYTGFLGEINHVHHLERTPLRRNTEARAYRSVLRKTQLYVNLRCLKIEGAKGTVYVGGGIVDSSIPEKEWQETVDKSTTMLSII
jgi:isochorismate synthase